MQRAAVVLPAGGGFALGEAIWLLAAAGRHASTLLAAGADVVLATLLLGGAGDARRHRVAWVGSGAAFFRVVLLSVRTLLA